MIDRSDVTVIVPTMNEAGNIERFLNAVPPDLRLIVVDSSTDETPNIVEAVRPSATVIRVVATIPVARQLGAELAETTWLLYTDADVVFAPSYFDRLANLPDTEALGGVVGVKSTVTGFEAYHRWFVRGQAILSALGIPAASGSNMLLRRSCLHDIGGFDLHLTVNEDTEIMFRLAKTPWGISFEPSLVVTSFDHRRLEQGLIKKVLHGAIRNTALWLGIFDTRIRTSDWGYWSSVREQKATPRTRTESA